MSTSIDLMAPRVIVENLWPGCEFEVGEILTLNKDGHYVGNNSFIWTLKEDVEPFPYLMRPLKWWEKREVSEMPEYVKINKDTRGLYDLETFGQYLKAGTIIKVVRWFGTSPFVTKSEFILACYIDPATESEYQSYLNSKHLKT